jgi:SAM-dependent methyltransferase
MEFGEMDETSQQFDSVHFDYGMNFPEERWVWSTFDFGLSVCRPAQYLIVQCRYFQKAGTLDVYNVSLGSRRYLIANGLLRIVLNYSDRSYHFRLRPKVSLATDVRELGLLIENILLFNNTEELERYRHSNTAAELTSSESDFIPAANKKSEFIFLEHTYRNFINKGWVNSVLYGTQLELRYVPPFAVLPAPEVPLDVVVNGDRRVQIFRKVTGTALRPVESSVFCILDIEPVMQPHFDGGSFDVHVIGHEWQSMHWRGFGSEPLPDANSILRVAGPITTQMFCFTGASWYNKIERLLRTALAPSLDDIGDILDWGCGCARIARFFPTAIRHRLYGADIDRVNIEWCQRNIVAAAWNTIAARPPLPYPDGKFGLIFGHSVFTHLSEEDQFKWLAELNRVLKLGGLCLVTVNAELSMYDRFYPNGRPISRIVDYLQDGFLDDGWLDVGVDSTSPGSYRTVTHSDRYLITRWSKYFEVLDLIPGFADLQTMAVLRKRHNLVQSTNVS